MGLALVNTSISSNLTVTCIGIFGQISSSSKDHSFIRMCSTAWMFEFWADLACQILPMAITWCCLCVYMFVMWALFVMWLPYFFSNICQICVQGSSLQQVVGAIYFVCGIGMDIHSRYLAYMASMLDIFVSGMFFDNNMCRSCSWWCVLVYMYKILGLYAGGMLLVWAIFGIWQPFFQWCMSNVCIQLLVDWLMSVISYL